MLPDFGTFYTQNRGTGPVHLCVPGASPTVMRSDKKLFGITFIVDIDGQQMMGTLECSGTKEDAFKAANELLSIGVLCQPRPDLAYTGTDGIQQIVPFRLYEQPKPLSQEAQDRIKAAEAKRLRRASKQQLISTTK